MGTCFCNEKRKEKDKGHKNNEDIVRLKK